MRLVNWVNADLGCGLAAFSPLLPHQDVHPVFVFINAFASLVFFFGAYGVTSASMFSSQSTRSIQFSSNQQHT
jgi:hypothetical protein